MRAGRPRARFGMTLLAAAAAAALTVTNLTVGLAAQAAPVPAELTVSAPSALAVDPSTGDLYVGSVDSGGDHVVVIDGVTGATIANVPSPAEVRSIAVDPVHRRAYAATDSGAVLVLDTDSNTRIATIVTGQRQLSAIAVNPQTQTVYATVTRFGFVVLIDGATNAVTGTPAVPGGPDNQVTVDTDTNRVYVGDANTLSIIDGTTGAVIRSVSTPFVVGTLALDITANRLYTSSTTGITVVDPDTLTRLATIRPTGSIADNALARSPVTGRLFGVTRNDTVTVIDPSTQTERTTLPLPANSADTARITVDPARGTVFIASPATNTITVLSPPSVDGTAPTGTDSTAYGFTYTLPAAPATTVRLTSGALPPGITVEPTGQLTGTPTTPGTYTFTITATNAIGPDTAATDTILINAAGTPPTIAGTAAAGTVDVAYSYQYRTTGNPVPTVTITDGELPPGLTLSSEGILTGSPTTAGTYQFTVTADNGITPDVSLTQTLVIAPATPPTSEPTSHPSATAPAVPAPGSEPSSSSGSNSDGNTPPDDSPRHGDLAYTGAAIGRPITAALAMLCLGALLLRRRRAY